jgi:hypothetical protein
MDLPGDDHETPSNNIAEPNTGIVRAEDRNVSARAKSSSLEVELAYCQMELKGLRLALRRRNTETCLHAALDLLDAMFAHKIMVVPRILRDDITSEPGNEGFTLRVGACQQSILLEPVTTSTCAIAPSSYRFDHVLEPHLDPDTSAVELQMLLWYFGRRVVYGLDSFIIAHSSDVRNTISLINGTDCIAVVVARSMRMLNVRALRIVCMQLVSDKEENASLCLPAELMSEYDIERGGTCESPWYELTTELALRAVLDHVDRTRARCSDSGITSLATHLKIKIAPIFSAFCEDISPLAWFTIVELDGVPAARANMITHFSNWARAQHGAVLRGDTNVCVFITAVPVHCRLILAGREISRLSAS